MGFYIIQELKNGHCWSYLKIDRICFVINIIIYQIIIFTPFDNYQRNPDVERAGTLFF